MIGITGALIIATATTIGGAGGQAWVSTAGSIEFGVSHPFHHVVGKSTQVQAVASISAGVLEGAARVAVRSFDSGNANRDAHMLEVIEAVRHPMALVQFTVRDFALPEAGSSIKLKVKGQVSLRGAKTEVPIELDISRSRDDTLSVSFTFTDSLDAHGVERPELMFVAIDDALRISGSLTLKLK